MSDATVPGTAPDVVCRLARDPAELRGYFALRRQIFCLEQRLFDGDDRDVHDDGAYPIVCLHGARVIGVVAVNPDGTNVIRLPQFGFTSFTACASALSDASQNNSESATTLLNPVAVLKTVDAVVIPYSSRNDTVGA